MSITACLVTRNHQTSLASAIQSLTGFASEVLVVDTGSSDDTISIAQNLGARVVPFDWSDDFSAACNFALDSATQDWIIWINPDEELLPVGLPQLLEMMKQQEHAAFRLKVLQQLRPDPASAGTSDSQLRLFRRDLAPRYRGRLHPDFAVPLEDLAIERKQRVTPVEITLRRHAYLSLPTPDKMRWVVRLLEAELRDRPGQLATLIELGRNLLWLNDPRGHELLAQAAAQVWKERDRPRTPTPWVGSLIEYLLKVSPEQSKSTLSRQQAIELGNQWFGDTPPVVWAMAEHLFQSRDFEAAATLLERLVHMGRTGYYNSGGGFNPDIIGRHALQNLGICCLHLARWENARICFARLLLDPNHRDVARQGMQMAEAQQKPD